MNIDLLHTKVRLCAILPVVIFLFSCNNKKNTNHNKVETPATPVVAIPENKAPLLPDTSISLSFKSFSKPGHNQITEEIAKQALYKYFKKRGLLTENVLPDSLTENDYQNQCVYYDTLFVVQSNKENCLAAIIRYWKTSPDGSGNCYQPHNSMLLNTSRGIVLDHTDFIPENLEIEKVETSNSTTIISGQDYNCGTDKIVRNFTAYITFHQ